MEYISFDAAGTLIQPFPSVGVIYAEVLRDYGIHAVPLEIEKKFRAAFKRVRSQPGTLLDQAAWKTIVEYTIQPWASHHLDAVFESLWQTFARPERWSIMPGVVPLLQHLQAKGYPLIVLSNNDQRLHSVMNGLELSQYFHRIFISVAIGYEKPDIRLFQHVTRALNISPHSILHVGDNIEEDHQGALNAGWQSYCIGHNHHSLALLLKTFQNY